MKTGETILLIDDDRDLRDLISEYLEGYGYRVVNLPSGEKAAEMVRAEKPGVVILDVMMPGKDGLEVLGELREHFTVPVIMLTAKGEDTDRIVGLELGADDYMGKPFNPRELLARIKAVRRRYETSAGRSDPAPSSRIIECGGLRLNMSKQTLLIETDELELARTEFRLLKVFMEHPGIALSRDQLMNKVWDRDFSAYDRSIDVHVHKLRSLLKPYEKHKNRIRTVWGTGYMFLED